MSLHELNLISPGWPWREKLSSSRIIMIGGDLRPDAQNRLQEALNPAEFTWITVEQNKNTRGIQSCVKRIKQGTVDIVFLLTGFVSHGVSSMIVKAVKNTHGVDLVYISRGYGLQQICQGIESFVELDVEKAE